MSRTGIKLASALGILMTRFLAWDAEAKARTLQGLEQRLRQSEQRHVKERWGSLSRDLHGRREIEEASPVRLEQKDRATYEGEERSRCDASGASSQSN